MTEAELREILAKIVEDSIRETKVGKNVFATLAYKCVEAAARGAFQDGYFYVPEDDYGRPA